MIPLLYLGALQWETGREAWQPLPSNIPIPSTCIPTCANDFVHPTNLGDPFEGGYYGGAMKIGNTIYALIVSPTSFGKLSGLYYTTNTNASLTTTEFNAMIPYDGYNNTQILFQKYSNFNATNNSLLYAISQVNNGMGLNGESYTDWYIPSIHEWLIVYRNLNPIDSSVVGESGAKFAYPCVLCGNTVPVTTHPLFKKGGTETFDLPWAYPNYYRYITSTFFSASGFVVTLPYGYAGGEIYQFMYYTSGITLGPSSSSYNSVARLIRRVRLI